MKKAIRKAFLQARKDLPKDIVQKHSAIITEKVLAKSYFQKAQTVMIYMDFRKEVATKALIEACWAAGKKVVVPRVMKEGQLLLISIESFEDFELSSFGILEPIPRADNQPDAASIDLVLVPGVAFDEEGYRMGYGGGFYDRLILRFREDVVLCALAFEVQMTDKLPVEPHDQQMDVVITEARDLVFTPGLV